jgi:hypothetical protein
LEQKVSITTKARTQAPRDKNNSAEIKKVEQALHTLLTAIEQHKMPSRPNDGRVPSFAEFMASVPYGSLERDPVGYSLRQGVSICGQWLWNLTRCVDKMRDSLHRVAGNSGRRMSIMDRCWDGVGGKWFS